MVHALVMLRFDQDACTTPTPGSLCLICGPTQPQLSGLHTDAMAAAAPRWPQLTVTCTLTRSNQSFTCPASGCAMQEKTVAEAADPAEAILHPRTCLVVCPSTLVQHWAHEMNRYIDSVILRPVAYSGVPAERQALQVG